MSTTTTHTTETTVGRGDSLSRPPTIAEIVREKTDNGALIIDFFTDVMRGNIEGAQLCHRIDAAKELVKFGSEEAVIFLAKYKGIPCGHSLRRRRSSAGPCIAEERTLVEVTLNAPAALTRDFLTVLSGIDELLMRSLIRAQTVHGDTIIEFLDDVMQDRNDGFKTHHRIAAAKELIVHILRDEQCPHTPSPSPTPSPSTGEGREPALTPSPSTGEGWGEGDSILPSPPRPRGTQTTHPSFRRKPESSTRPSFRRKPESRGAGGRVQPDPARPEHTPSPS